MNNYLMAESKVNRKLNNEVTVSNPNRNYVRSFGGSVSAVGRISDWQNNELVFIENEVHILPTHMTPEYILNNEGFIKIRGRGLYCEKPDFTEQIISWIDDYLKNPSRVTYVTIAFEYLNSISTSVLVTILRKLYQIVLQSKTLVVQWYYEPDDENILDRGRYVALCCDIPIEFIMTSNVACV